MILVINIYCQEYKDIWRIAVLSISMGNDNVLYDITVVTTELQHIGFSQTAKQAECKQAQWLGRETKFLRQCAVYNFVRKG